MREQVTGRTLDRFDDDVEALSVVVIRIGDLRDSAVAGRVLHQQPDLTGKIGGRPGRHVHQILAIHRQNIVKAAEVVVVDLAGHLRSDVVAGAPGSRDRALVGGLADIERGGATGIDDYLPGQAGINDLAFEDAMRAGRAADIAEADEQDSDRHWGILATQTENDHLIGAAVQVRAIERIVVLTGAGISAESGLTTFRGPGGLWRNHRPEELATPQAFARDPQLVLDFYNERRRRLGDPSIAPNAAHRALAGLERSFGPRLQLVTQNVDDLHERAGSKSVVHMHGELMRTRCGGCGRTFADRDDIRPSDRCGDCDAAAMRPDVVWFGEVAMQMERIGEALAACDLFVAIGTSGSVYRAAGFVRQACTAGAATIEINPEASAVASDFTEHIRAPAATAVPALVVQLMQENAAPLQP